MITLRNYCAQRKLRLNVFEMKIYDFYKYNQELPEWAVKKDGVTYVYQHQLDFLRNRKDLCQKYMTNPIEGLYWYLRKYYTDSNIALKMSIHSRKYHNFTSWSVFLNKDLFNLREENEERFMWSMAEDFFRNGAILLYHTAKRYGLREI